MNSLIGGRQGGRAPRDRVDLQAAPPPASRLARLGLIAAQPSRSAGEGKMRSATIFNRGLPWVLVSRQALMGRLSPAPAGLVVSSVQPTVLCTVGRG